MATSPDSAELRGVDSGAVIRGVVTLLFTPFTDDGKRFDAAMTSPLRADSYPTCTMARLRPFSGRRAA